MMLADHKAQILIVDDTTENIDVLAGVLREHYQIKVALNGPKALKIACAEPTPDMILLDVMMPEMDGHEVCRRLKVNPKTADVPVIFVTAKTALEEEVKGFELGAADYITKPINPDKVLSRVRAHLAASQARNQLAGLSKKLARYLSPQVYQSIFEGKHDARLGSSRKKLTVFFSDIVGFTKQIEGLEPEDTAFILNGYLSRMAEVVIEHGGTLDKFIGDAVLVFYGDPESKGPRDDAMACVKMAMAMQEEIQALNEEWKRTGIGAEFQVRMGIASGFCTVGNFGCEQRMDYTIIGNQVNLAARLEAAAAPDEILVAHETWLMVKDTFECTPKNPIHVKGLDRPVQTYVVSGKRDLASRNDAIAESFTGFSLTLDPDEINPEDRVAIKEQLKSALRHL